MGDMTTREGSRAGAFWASPCGRRVVAGGVLAVQAWVLFAPATPNPGIPPTWHVDKLVHAGIFAAATWAVSRAGARPWPTALVMIAYAAVSEVIQQTLLASRSGDPTDLAADVVGVALGVWLVRHRP